MDQLPVTRTSFRVGEAERDTACDALSEHFAAGRLDPAELDDRLARAVSARSQAELRALFLDLGPRRDAPPVAPDEPVTVPQPVSALLPVLATLLVLSALLAGGMLLVLVGVSGPLLLAAVVGGTAAAVGGCCATVMGQAAMRRR